MTSTGFSIQKLFSDPNIQNALAGVGSRLDPEGVGGALGGATIQYNRSKAAQSALEGQENQRKASNLLQLAALNASDNPEQSTFYRNKAIEMLGGFTNGDQPGINSLKVGPKGDLTFNVNPPGVPAPLNQQGPVSSENPSVNGSSATTTPSSASTNYSPTRPRTSLSNIFPF